MRQLAAWAIVLAVLAAAVVLAAHLDGRDTIPGWDSPLPAPEEQP